MTTEGGTLLPRRFLLGCTSVAAEAGDLPTKRDEIKRKTYDA